MWPNPQETANLVTFTEEILNEKLQFLCGANCGNFSGARGKVSIGKEVKLR